MHGDERRRSSGLSHQLRRRGRTGHGGDEYGESPVIPIDYPSDSEYYVPNGNGNGHSEPLGTIAVPVASRGVIVAVKVTDCPNTDGFGAEVKLVVVLAALTVCK